MENLKQIAAKNISDLRKGAGLTQLELAERLNYSDKAVSKWERGESLPDVAVLLTIARLFDVTVDYLLTESHPIEAAAAPLHKRRHLVITLLSGALVWLIATVLFVIAGLSTENPARAWLLFVYALPVTAVVFLVFNSLWGRRRMNYAIISVLVWSILLSLFLSLTLPTGWMLFLLGVPAQAILFIWSRLSR